MARSFRTASYGAAFFVPVVAWACYIFLVLPSVIVLPISFGSASELEFPPRAFSLALYQQFFTDAAWWGAMAQSLMIACMTALATTALGLPAAYALQRARLPGARLINGFIMGPLLVPVIVLGLGLYLQFAPWNLLNSNVSLFLSHTMLAVPFMMISVGASLRHLDPVLENAALIMGASRPAIFFRVVLPQLKAGIAAGALFAFLISFDEVIIAYFVTGPETQTLPVKMYSALRWELSPVIAAASTLLTVFSILLASGIMMLQRKEQGR